MHDVYPILLLVCMIFALWKWPKFMMPITTTTALLMLIIFGGKAPELIAHVAPNFATIFVVMSVTQLCVKHVLEGGANERINMAIAMLAAHNRLSRLPASVLIPLVFVPASMFLAMMLHNITAIAVLTPLIINLSSRYEMNPGPSIAAMLIASNLGGASMAFGDTPAIIQRTLWGFSPSQFAFAMFPRNLVILFALTAVACVTTWYPVRRRGWSWSDVMVRLKTRDEILQRGHYQIPFHNHQAKLGGIVLAGFIGSQFVWPHYTLVLGCLAFLVLLLSTPERKYAEALGVLGVEPTVVIGSLLVVASAVEHTRSVAWVSAYLSVHSGPGLIESLSYLIAATISADGAAATLGPMVHDLSGGSMISAWQLASGICAGSSVFLTSASAGPILYGTAKANGYDLSFRGYARFGFPFSLAMIVIYVLLNMVAR